MWSSWTVYLRLCLLCNFRKFPGTQSTLFFFTQKVQHIVGNLFVVLHNKFSRLAASDH